MPTIKVKLRKKQDTSYGIIISGNCTDNLPEYLKKQKIGDKYAIITDSKVKKIYGGSLKKYLRKNGLIAELFAFSEGEKSKNISTVEKLSEEMIEKGFNRKDAVIALGGGVVGDTAGFLASIYMRVGTFYQPKAVFMDPKYLKTLSRNQIRNGLAEIIKYGVIMDKNLFTFIEQNLNKIFELKTGAIEKIITRSVKIKAAIVEKDEKESKLRMILNYGHTYGHAIEKLSGYKLPHGYAISIGMVIANEIAVKKGLLKEQDSERIKNLLKKAGLPVTTMKKPTKKDLLSDKKRYGNILNLILPTTIGKAKIYQEKCQ
ncbi:3-dehydroquinate synthase [Candidatus Peregrinibacteria bacterium]|nr:3-dehydroquinate synthase [Candidatus Peregrinibacteria bacterium]